MQIRIIYLLAILNTVVLAGSAQQVSIIAHRGASSLAPENTMASFRKAIEVGADYFELDVRASKDDSLMVIHDLNIRRTTNGSGSMHDLTYAEIRAFDAGSWFGPDFSGEKIPTLREALQLSIDHNVKVCVEIKDYDKTSQVVKLIRDMKAGDRVVIFCFDFDVIKTARKLDSTIPVCYLNNLIGEKDILDIRKIEGEYAGAGAGGNQAIIDFSHQQKVKFWRWTVNDVSEMTTLMGRGIDGIITNYPQELVKLRTRTTH